MKILTKQSPRYSLQNSGRKRSDSSLSGLCEELKSYEDILNIIGVTKFVNKVQTNSTGNVALKGIDAHRIPSLK